MPDLNFDSYFKNTNNQYYDSMYLITILENILESKIDEIKKEVTNAQIMVSEEQIVKYLDKKFAEEEPELKKRIESPKPKRSKNLIEMNYVDIETSTQEFRDSLNANKYYFEPYTLKYFRVYSSIVRKKALLLLNIIEKIGNKDCGSIQNLLSDLDIKLDEKGNILKEDIIRLITPTIYNINELKEKVTQANDFSTYLSFKISKHSLYKDGWSEGELYPTESIQIKSLYYDYLEGNVSLSANQKAELQEQENRNIENNTKFILDMFD